MDATLTEPLIDTERLAVLLKKLRAKQALLPDMGDLKSDNERAANYALRNNLASVISALMNTGILDKPLTQLADLETRRDAVETKRRQLEHTLAEMPEVTEIKDRHDREAAHRREHVVTQLRLLDQGMLHHAYGETYEPLSYLETRIAEVRATLEQRRHWLAETIEAAERLLAS